MKWHYSIWLFLLVILNFTSSLYCQQPSFFQGLRLGMSYEEVKDALKDQRVFINDREPTFYNLSIPIYDILSVYDQPKNRFVDAIKQRIYYDDQVFFDLRNLSLSTKTYKLSYRDPYYLVEYPELVSYKVAYANRLNPLLYSLRLKFFQQHLYAIEYSSQLSFLEFNRLQNNYFKNYGRILTPGDQSVEKADVISLIHVDKQDVDTIRVDRHLQQKIFSYLQQQSDGLINQLYHYVQDHLKEGDRSKLEILADKKHKLQEGLKKQFEAVDEL